MGTNIYKVSQWLLGFVNLEALLVIPVTIMSYIILRQIYRREFDLTPVIYILILLPVMTPFFTRLLGFDYFTAMNHYLQRDEVLIVSAMLLILIFFFSAVLGSRVKLSANILKTRSVDLKIGIIMTVFAINFVLLLLFLELDTILETGYGQIKENQSNYSSLVNQVFNLSMAMTFASISSRQRRRLAQVIIMVFIVLALLFARRTLAVGLLILLFYTLRDYKLRIGHVLGGVLALFALWFVGEVRTTGLLPYLSGDRADSVFRSYYSMPGGGANIFIGTMGVIHLLGSGVLKFPYTMPILLWVNGESSSTIYPRMGYAYNGGMHIASVLYWNFGLIGVVLGGILLGAITSSAGKSLRGLKAGKSGNMATSLSIGFVLILPNVIWYSPIGFVKLSIAIIVASVLLRIVVTGK